MIVKYILILALVVSSSEGEGSLWCYECGTDVEGTVTSSCEFFLDSPGWTQYKRECGENMICLKTKSHSGAETRGCTPKFSALGTEHREGCWMHRTSGLFFCNCNSNFCNHSSSILLGSPDEVVRKLVPFSIILVILCQCYFSIF